MGDVPPGAACWRFGDYLILREIARGGMGIVYQARQLSLNRVVALKTILPGCLTDGNAIRRFATETQATAKLQHPNIVAVHDAGEWRGRPYYAMEYVEGQSLAQKVQQYPLSARPAAAQLKSVAEAIHYAHSHGVLHRDLKPSNIVIDGEDRPHITDFGLAKLVDEGSEMTLSGVIMGSPSYLAPEQARGRASAVTVQSDVYSLGAILYESITGRAPFKGQSTSATLQLVLGSDPIPPRQMNPMIPRDLETICLKCLQKEPARRYASARALSEDLGRFLEGKAILARPVGVLGKTWRRCRRQPALATAIAVSAALLISGLAGVTWQWRRAEGARQLQRLRAYAADMRSADSALQQGNLGQVNHLLDRYLPQPGDDDLRGLEWRYLWQRSRSEDSGGFEYLAIPCMGDWSPDGQWLAVSGLDGWVRIHDWQGRHVVRQASGFTRDAAHGRTVAFQPGGHLVAAATTTNILVWDTARWRVQRQFPCQDAVIAFSPDGQHLAAWGSTGLQAWSTLTWQLEVGPDECPVERGFYPNLAFTPDSTIVVLGNRSLPGIVFWSLASRSRARSDLAFDNLIRLTLSLNGRWLSASSAGGRVTVWDLAFGCVPLDLPVRTPWPAGLAFSPDGHALAVGGSSQEIFVFQTGTTNLLRVLKGHRAEIWWLCYSHDGQWLLSGSEDKTVRRWALAGPSREPRLFQTPEDTWLLDVTSGGARALLWRQRDRTIVESDVSDPALPPRITFQGVPPSRGLVRVDGHFLFAVSREGGRVLNVQSGQPLFPDASWTNSYRPSAISRDGRWLSGTELANGEWSGGIWDLQQGGRWRTVPDQAPEDAFGGNAAFSPNGRLLAYATKAHQIKVYQLDTARMRFLPGHSRPIYALRFSPDNRWLASSSFDATARVWEVATGRPVTPWLVGHRAGINWLHFSPDGRTLVTGSDTEPAFRFWHLPTGTEVLQDRSACRLLRRALDSQNTTFLESVADSPNRVAITTLPPLTEIDAKRRAGGLLIIEP